VNNFQQTDALVPLADMMNHRRPRDTSWTFDNDQQSFVVESLRDLNLGEEVCDSYGKKCNSRYLLNYGFTVLNNAGHSQICF
jgi:protein-histidine N-methyltransferase